MGLSSFRCFWLCLSSLNIFLRFPPLICTREFQYNTPPGSFFPSLRTLFPFFVVSLLLSDCDFPFLLQEELIFSPPLRRMPLPSPMFTPMVLQAPYRCILLLLIEWSSTFRLISYFFPLFCTSLVERAFKTWSRSFPLPQFFFVRWMLPRR